MPDDLRARILEALVSAPVADVRDDPESAANHTSRPGRRHGKHRFHMDCALCQGEAATLTDAVMAVLGEPDPVRSLGDRVVIRMPGARMLDGREGEIVKVRDWDLEFEPEPYGVAVDGQLGVIYFSARQLEVTEAAA